MQRYKFYLKKSARLTKVFDTALQKSLPPQEMQGRGTFLQCISSPLLFCLNGKYKHNLFTHKIGMRNGAESLRRSASMMPIQEIDRMMPFKGRGAGTIKE